MIVAGLGVLRPVMVHPGRVVSGRAVRTVSGLVAAVVVATGCASEDGPRGFVDSFDGPDGLVADPGSDDDSPWTLTSGSLYRSGGRGWTGHPDDGSGPDDNGSAVFRMVSKADGYTDVTIHLQLLVDDFVSTPGTPEQDYDGAHVWVGYRSEYELYAVSVDRRDGRLAIKKKCPGGPSNGGTYIDLVEEYEDAPVPIGRWQDVLVTYTTGADGSVTISADRDGHRLQANDPGVGCAPLTSGRVGIRGDNAELYFKDIEVTPNSPPH